MAQIKNYFEVSVIWKQLLGFIRDNSKFILWLGLLLAIIYILDSVFSLYIPNYNDLINISDVGFLKFHSIDLLQIISLDKALPFGLHAFIFLLNIMICTMLFRKFLFNEYSGFFGLKIGRQELIVGLIGLIDITFINFMKPVFNWFNASQQPVNLLGLIIVAIIMVYVGMRFYLAAPLFLSENKINLLKAWEMSKNNAWNFFGLCIFSALVVAGLAVIIQICLILSAFLFGFDRRVISLEILKDKLFVYNANPYFIGFAKLIFNILIDVLRNILNVLIPVYAFNRICELSKYEDIQNADLQTA